MPLPDLTDAELIESRKLLLHFARLQLPDHPDLAEDLVQETLLSAYSAGDSFQGRALVNSWLFAILKNKIIDALRQIGRQRKVFTALDDELLDEAFESHFSQNGHWTPEEAVTTLEHSGKIIKQQRIPKNSAKPPIQPA